MLKLTIKPEAETEFDQAYDWYADRSYAAATGFVTEVSEAFLQISKHPGQGMKIEGNIRRRLLTKYPYSIIYEVIEDELFVLALAHAKRRPDYWRSRIDTPLTPPPSAAAGLP